MSKILASEVETDAKKQAAGQAYSLVPMLRKLYGDCPEQLIHDLLRDFLLTHPRQGQTRRQVALHEAGHFVAFEAEGMYALTATVSKSKFGRNEWGGEACAGDRPYITPSNQLPHDLLREARTAIAGPWAESALGDGDILSSIGELVEACILIARSAQLLGLSQSQLLTDTLATTTNALAANADVIEEIAQKLERAPRITHAKCRRVLARIPRTPSRVNLSQSNQHQEIVGLVIKFALPIAEAIMQAKDA